MTEEIIHQQQTNLTNICIGYSRKQSVLGSLDGWSQCLIWKDNVTPMSICTIKYMRYIVSVNTFSLIRNLCENFSNTKEDI